MTRFGFGPGRILAVLAAIIFAVAALGEWPADWQDEVEPIALALALFAASFASP
jgi:hypothetical protein